MFKRKDETEKKENGEDLRKELGLTTERADELANIVSLIMNQNAPGGGYGRTSHVLLSIAGRKDLNNVEKVACVFLFVNKMKLGDRKDHKIDNHKIDDEIEFLPLVDFDKREFLDIDIGISGTVITPEGIDTSVMVSVIMASLLSILKELPKYEAQDFCRYAIDTFSKLEKDIIS